MFGGRRVNVEIAIFYLPPGHRRWLREKGVVEVIDRDKPVESVVTRVVTRISDRITLSVQSVGWADQLISDHLLSPIMRR